MTDQQLRELEAQLAKRGYKKYKQAVVSSESWAWIKTIKLTANEYGEILNGYQIAFRVWDYTQFGQSGEDAYGFSFWTSSLDLGSRADLTSSWAPICDLDTFERMAADFYELTQKYSK